MTQKLIVIARSMFGLWFGLWTIAGVATSVAGLLILALQLYGRFHLGFWAHLTPAGILQGFNIEPPLVPWKTLQKGIDCLLFMPLSGVFIWCGLTVAAMAWIARKNMERKTDQLPEFVPATDERFAALGISHLEIRPEQ